MNNLPARIQESPLITEYDGVGMYEYANPESGYGRRRPGVPGAPSPRPLPPGPMPQAPRTELSYSPRRPRLIKPIEGIVYSDPQAVYDFLISNTYELHLYHIKPVKT